MKIKWLGHSCFIITLNDGTTILTDPVDADSGYNIGNPCVDAVTVSHDHHDHSNTAAVSAKTVIDTAAEYDVSGAHIKGIPTWHDELCGTKRGSNIMYLIEADGIRLLHAGDLGQLLDPLTLQEMGKVDILLLPIGGVYTIDYEKALTLINTVKPKITVPMHYKTPSIKFRLCDISPFLNRASDNFTVLRLNTSEFDAAHHINKKNLIIIPDYTR